MINSARPLWMLVRMNMILRMRHQAEYISPWVTNPCDVMDGAVGVNRIFSIRGCAIVVGVGEGDLVVIEERRKRKKFGGLEISFAMGDGTLDQIIQAFCPNTGLRNRFERHQIGRAHV